MSDPAAGHMSGQPSRTSILVAAARALGARDPDAKVRNPDHLAERLLGPEELAMIDGHPLSRALSQDYWDAIRDMQTFGLVWMMLVRTRFIEDALRHAVANGVRQVVVLGAGFDSRAYRLADLLRDCRVIELDSPATQERKKKRVTTVLGPGPHNVVHVSVDFARESLGHALDRAGHRSDEKTFYVWEGVTMYLPEAGVRETLRTIAAHSRAGGSLVLDYQNSAALDMIQNSSQGMTQMVAGWGEPFIFGVPGKDGTDFFRELGFEPSEVLALFSEELVQRYAIRSDGTRYGMHLYRDPAQAAAMQQRMEEARKRAAEAEANGTVLPNYFLAELEIKS